MKALLLDAPGPPETLRLGEAQAPHAGPGEIVVRVKACGLNPVDYRVAQSGNPAWTWPHILGLDVAGVVEEVGQDVSGFVPGDKVAGTPSSPSQQRTRSPRCLRDSASRGPPHFRVRA